MSWGVLVSDVDLYNNIIHVLMLIQRLHYNALVATEYVYLSVDQLLRPEEFL